MKGIALLRTTPAALWIAVFTTALVVTGHLAIQSRIDAAAAAANDVARDDAVSFADAAGSLAGYELTITIADGYNLLSSPLLADRSPEGCLSMIAPFGKGTLTAAVFHNGALLCSHDVRTGGPLEGELLAWTTNYWAEKSSSGLFEISGAGSVGAGTYSAAPGGNFAVAVPRDDLGVVAFLPIQSELQRHLNSFGNRASGVAMVDRSGTVLGARDHDGPVPTAGENLGTVDGSLSTGPGGIEARWAKGIYGQRFGALAVGVNQAPTEEHLALFQNRSRLAALGVGLFGIGAVGAVVVWGSRSLRRVARLVEAAADGTATNFEASRYAPAEVARLTDTLRHLAQRRRRYDIERERARQQESAGLGLELHDDVIQRLAAAAMLGSTRPDLAAGSLSETAARIRNLSAGLCPPALSESGLAAAISAVRTDSCALTVTDTTDGHRFEAPIERVVYRNIVEAVRNACTHGAAAHIEVTISHNDNTLTVTVDDDGTGIDPAMVAGRDGHFGIVSMQALMARLGGSAAIEPAAVGTRVTLSCPIAVTAGAAAAATV